MSPRTPEYHTAAGRGWSFWRKQFRRCANADVGISRGRAATLVPMRFPETDRQESRISDPRDPNGRTTVGGTDHRRPRRLGTALLNRGASQPKSMARRIRNSGLAAGY